MKEKNKIIYGDNLEILRDMEDESVDLIYLDPPFFSNRNYEVIWGDADEVRSFEDRWDAGLEGYLLWMRERLRELHRVLNPIGTIYLHCDWHASHYLKVEMDKIFGYNNFRNEIIWQYQPGSTGKKDFGRKHDNILRYSKTDNYSFYPDSIREPYSKKTLERLKHNGAREKNINKVLERGGRIPIDVWYYPSIQGNAAESLKYPTQKPMKLLERIINASSNEGDIVLDPFCGCGTTVAVARQLNRNFIGIDVSLRACTTIADRLNYSRRDIMNVPFTISDLEQMKPHEFQDWVCEIMVAKNTSKNKATKPSGADGGVDGIIMYNKKDVVGKYGGCPIQVKQSHGVGLIEVKKLKLEMIDRNVMYGFLIGYSFGSGAKKQVAHYKREGTAFIELIEAKDLCGIVQYEYKDKDE